MSSGAETRPGRVSDEDAASSRSDDLAGRLRTAAMRGDQVLVTRLLAELLRFRRATAERRVALRALADLIQSLRSAAMTDDLTGVHNRRGFLAVGTRFLNVARRELKPAYLIYFDLNGLKQINDTQGHLAGDALIRQMGLLLRELFPNYGVYEVLGRLGGDEFAALTTDMKCPSRSEILLRARMWPARAADSPALSLSVGFAYFNPLLPLGIGELLKNAERAMYEHKRRSQAAASSFVNHRRGRPELKGTCPGTRGPVPH